MAHPITEYTKEAREMAERWSSPYSELSKADDLQAIALAKMGMQTLILLHGGGLIAIPTFSTALHFGRVTIGTLIVTFAIGLIAAVM